MAKIKLTYREIKSRQIQDIKKNISGYYVYRHLSSPLTWLFIKFDISPNAITIASLFIPLIGFFFLFIGTYLTLIAGILFFILFKILDMCDGEVARLLNKTSIEGVYYDRISHYSFTYFIGIGIGAGLFRLYGSYYFLIAGFLFAFAFILENAMQDLLLRPLLKAGNEEFYKKLLKNLKEASWSEANIFSKIAGIYPVQGIVYSDTFLPIVLLILISAGYLQSLMLKNPLADFMLAIAILTYLLLALISKSFWSAAMIYKIEKNRHISKLLQK
ncbi:CDP-alcohol phosphatidyltransferase family protein [Candidatus Woesearchaeota archaeon]|nr:CDP-alcohol phosphatidyltransferase family protein [Candidatus Woesearchaeota archaeon]